MRILGAIVFPATEIMPLRQAKITPRSTVGWQFVGFDSKLTIIYYVNID
jgi:hypothetical protein